MAKNINLKIYGITTVGSKGQVIIPKDCRDDFKIKTGDDFWIVTLDDKAFGIGRGSFSESELKKKLGIFDLEISGNIKVGTKFQFVIPCSIREELSISCGDSLVVVGKQGHGKKEGLGFVKNNNINYLLDYIRYYTKD